MDAGEDVILCINEILGALFDSVTEACPICPWTTARYSLVECFFSIQADVASPSSGSVAAEMLINVAVFTFVAFRLQFEVVSTGFLKKVK